MLAGRSRVGVVGEYSFQFLMEEVAVAVRYGVPYVLVMLNNGYMGLIRQGELKYGINFAVDIGYRGPSSDYGIDNPMAMEAISALGRRVTSPEDIMCWSGRCGPASSGWFPHSSRS